MGSGVLNLLGSNLKVHFAGSDGGEHFYCALIAAKINYRLYSCYKFIVTKKVTDDLTLPKGNIIKQEQIYNKHVIQDSGLFTLMFGADKGKKLDMQGMIDWQDKLINFVKQNDLTCTCVEMDVQKVLGVQQAWELRYRMKKLLKNRQINVFHFEDGKDGLDRLIDFAEYIAISVPELRIVKPKTFRDDVHRLAYYIKSKKPEIDIHLLGCTDVKMLEQNSFCTSADSTAWLRGVKYGYMREVNSSSPKHINQFRRELFEKRKAECLKEIQKLNLSFGSKLLDYTTNASLCASICKMRYEKAAGSQD